MSDSATATIEPMTDAAPLTAQAQETSASSRAAARARILGKTAPRGRPARAAPSEREDPARGTHRAWIDDRAEGRAGADAKQGHADDEVRQVVAEGRAEETGLSDLEEQRGR